MFAKMMDILSDDDRPHYYYGRNHFILHKFFLLHGFFNLKKDNLLKTHNFLTDIDDDDIRWFFFLHLLKKRSHAILQLLLFQWKYIYCVLDYMTERRYPLKIKNKYEKRVIPIQKLYQYMINQSHESPIVEIY